MTFPDPATLIVRSLANDYAPGTVLGRHTHAWRQLIFAEAGAMRVISERDEYFVPPSMAVSMPAHRPHEIRMETAVRMRTLYLREAGGAAAVLAVSPFLSELIRRIVAQGYLRGDDETDAAFARILRAEIAAAPAMPLTMRRPADPRAARAADLIDARDEASLAQIARDAGASLRTLQRLFTEETGMRLSHWRQQRRLLRGAEALAGGESVLNAALAASYQSQSAFVAAFGKSFGVTPWRWAAARRAR